MPFRQKEILDLGLRSPLGGRVLLSSVSVYQEKSTLIKKGNFEFEALGLLWGVLKL